MMKKLLISLLAILSFLQLNAERMCCLLTCEPGEKTYELYGHSALMMLDDEHNIVYNYGVFSFSDDNFILKFTLGKTYYLLDYDDFYNFISSRKTNVWISRIDLNDAELNTLDSLLRENLKPENRRYLYNYFSDNCATRIRDLIEKSVDGKVVYKEGNYTPISYRESVKQYVGDTWQMFGINLLLGAPADTLISMHNEMYLPIAMKNAFENAQIVKGDTARKLISEAPTVIPSMNAKAKKNVKPISPTFTFALILAVVTIFTFLGFKKNKKYQIIDILLFSFCGTIGLIICFVSFFSIHPTVFPNYLVLIFHPLQFVAIPLMFWCKKCYKIYAIFNCVMLTLLCVVGLAGLQHIDIGIYLLIVTFAVRTTFLLNTKKS